MTLEGAVDLAREIVDEFGDDPSNTRIERLASWILDNFDGVEYIALEPSVDIEEDRARAAALLRSIDEANGE